MQIVTTAVPFLATVMLAGAIRGIAGAERSAPFIGAAFPLGFLIGWGVMVAPGWFAYDALGRVGHIVFGGALAGLLLEVWAPRRAIVIAVAAIFLLGSAWAEANGGLWPGKTVPVATWLNLIAVAALGAGLVWRLDALGRARTEHAHTASTVVAVTLAAMLALALAVVAAAADDTAMRGSGSALALALAGLAAWQWVFGGAPSYVVVFSAAGGALAIAWALFERADGTLAGLLVCGLILFADGTARRIRLPRARISRILYTLLLCGASLLPLALAGILTMVLHGAV